MTTTTTTLSLAAALDDSDLNENELAALIPRGELDRRWWRAEAEEAVEACGGGFCVLCAAGGVVTATLHVREVAHDFGGVLRRERGSCSTCGGRVARVAICEACDATGDDHHDDSCPTCWSARGYERLLNSVVAAAADLEEAGAEDAQQYLDDLVDDDTGAPRAPAASDLSRRALGAWSEIALVQMGVEWALNLAGIDVYALSMSGVDRVWRVVREAWCRAYDAGGDRVIEDARADLERKERESEEDHNECEHGSHVSNCPQCHEIAKRQWMGA